MKELSNISLKPYNTFGIDAKARCLAEYESVEELQHLLQKYCDSRKLHIGGGSNLLFLNDFDGVILHSAILGVEVVEETDKDVVVKVGSGMVWDERYITHRSRKRKPKRKMLLPPREPERPQAAQR